MVLLQQKLISAFKRFVKTCEEALDLNEKEIQKNQVSVNLASL